MKITYYLCWEEDPQWFCGIFKKIEGEKVAERTLISSLPIKSYLGNLLDRKPSKIKLNNFNYKGISISKKEYDHLSRLKN